jgi:hypothetical protein
VFDSKRKHLEPRPAVYQDFEQLFRRHVWERLSESTRDQLKYDVIARVFGRLNPGAPVVEVFGSFAGDEEGRLAIERLLHVNPYSRTQLCTLMRRLGSDKGLSRHNYTAVYAHLFAGLRSRALRLFELGIGTDNPELPSTMGSTGVPGASLRGWAQFFPQAKIFAADIDKNILLHDERITTFYCDQTDPRSVQQLWEQPELQADFDILIEDGLHTFEANRVFLEGSLHKVRRSGYYIVEDVAGPDLPRWREALPGYRAAHGDFTFCIVTLPWFRTDDNTLIVAKRAP